ncbi:DUF294 nucleotidyltransferase-like domain-containing protein [Pseudoalteromonas sp. T1lg75]|uniref:DUF294 nucleotidyltransferase-like domain-containing protein n=1 Tax=Pseudoalteromonas sp. T1lg75 TaxID=2077102 RepID=UPI000CF6C4F9|nr:DUF294 nucleotidyltransferase-like domain-containing protein [Pseudoalteromonas sp. T1lg75]
MSALHQDILDFVTQQAPFNALPDSACDYFTHHLEVIYVTRENQHQWLDSAHPKLFLLRSGVIELVAADGEPIARLTSGDYFGYPSLLSGETIKNRIEVKREALVYMLSQADFDYLRHEYKAFEQYFVRAHSNRLLSSKYQHHGDSWSERKISQLMTRQAITLTPEASIRECAQTMSAHRVSSIMVTQGEGQEARLIGVVTDRDLRSRVLAEGVDPGLGIEKIMSVEPKFIFENNRVFSAMHLMLKHNIHHLPVLNEQHQPLGMVTSTDLLRQQKSDPVQLIGRIYKASGVADLKRYAQEVPELLEGFAYHIDDISLIGKLLSGISDALTTRLIQLFQQRHGDAPTRFSWICFGSQAREEQTLHSDQDNGLLLPNDLDESQLEYFKAMGEFVCQQLDVCGIRRCPGNIMASNEDCRLSLHGWLHKFERWLASPTPEAMLNCKIFFDIRFISGSSDLFATFSEALSALKPDQLFYRALASELNLNSVPIGLFNQLKTEADAERHKYIDLKRRGIVIINDIVRLYALQDNIRHASTLERLDALTKTQWLSKKDIFDLKDCWRYLTQLRLRAQLDNEPLPSNCINPDGLTSLERHQLKEAFYLIRQAQQAASFKFARGSL